MITILFASHFPLRAQAKAGQTSESGAGEPTAPELEASIKRAMEYLNGKEATGGPQYSDYVVFCGLPVVEKYPEFKGVIDSYVRWIAAHDQYNKQLPYQSACHVMALDISGEHEKAVDIFRSLVPSADDGLWDKVDCQIGWYLYGCIVADDRKLLESTFEKLLEMTESRPHRFHYFIAYCLWKAYEKTKDDRYRAAFLSVAEKMKGFREVILEEIAQDGHGGMALSVFCRAYQLSKDEEHREIARELVKILRKNQLENGSWNDKTAYTIMPVEGFTDYLQFCR